MKEDVMKKIVVELITTMSGSEEDEYVTAYIRSIDGQPDGYKEGYVGVFDDLAIDAIFEDFGYSYFNRHGVIMIVDADNDACGSFVLKKRATSEDLHKQLFKEIGYDLEIV